MHVGVAVLVCIEVGMAGARVRVDMDFYGFSMCFVMFLWICMVFLPLVTLNSVPYVLTVECKHV